MTQRRRVLAGGPHRLRLAATRQPARSHQLPGKMRPIDGNVTPLYRAAEQQDTV